MAAWMVGQTWGTWADVQIDFGRELYVPWRLSGGEVLYRDIVYFNGPLSAYLNALWFACAGTRIGVLIAANLAVAAGVSWLLYRLGALVSARAAAALGSLAFVLVYLVQQVDFPNFNYLCPYSHELTHGLLLSLVSLGCLHRFDRTGRTRELTIAGSLLGLVFLTKIEVFIALLGAHGVALAQLYRRRERLPRRTLLAYVTALVTPVVLAWALLTAAMPLGDAARGLIGGWNFIFQRELRNLHFYRDTFGSASLYGSLTAAALSTLVLAGALLVTCGLGCACARHPRLRTLLAAVGLAVAVAGPVWAVASRQSSWPPPLLANVLCPLPLMMLVALVGALRFRSGAQVPVDRLRVTLLVYALLLLLKVALAPTPYGYGFVLTVPATTLLIGGLWSWLPAGLARWGVDPAPLRAATLGAVLGIGGTYARCNILAARGASVAVTSNGLLRADAVRGRVVREFLAAAGPRIAPDQTLLVLPEGVMLNFLLGRATPTPYVNFMPPELIMFGEARILAALARRPPDLVALVHRPAPEYGGVRFGVDYGARFREWIDARYRPVGTFGDVPFVDDRRFGIWLLEPRPPAD